MTRVAVCTVLRLMEANPFEAGIVGACIFVVGAETPTSQHRMNAPTALAHVAGAEIAVRRAIRVVLQGFARIADTHRALATPRGATRGAWRI
jgi:hypothetical protein